MLALLNACTHIAREGPFWTQGAGGNVSLKDHGRLWIKASGWRLDAVNKNQGIVGVELKPFVNELIKISPDDRTLSETKYAELIQRFQVEPRGTNRPSMETGFHAALEAPLVAHFHSLGALLMYHHFENKIDSFKLQKWLASEAPFIKIAFVPALMPGLELTRYLMDLPACEIYILQNHGVVLQAPDISILDEWSMLEDSFLKSFGYERLLEKKIQKLKEPARLKELKLYFPDSAVFLERLKKALSSQDANDIDALELATATAWLFEAQPKLKELPLEISSQIAKLPTEEFRLKLQQKALT